MPVHARRYGAILEPIAVSIYFAPEAAEEWTRMGLSPEQAYVSSRAAPMGRVSEAVVVAAFYNFSPGFIQEALAWDIASPEDLLEVRTRLAGLVLGRLLDGDGLPDLQSALELLRRVVAAVRPEGRPLAAAHAALPWPAEPAAALWHAATVMREHRGDGHNAVLATHGVDGCAALALDAAFSGKPERYVDYRMWSAAEGDAARERLIERGYLTEEGSLTEPGAKFREMMELETDRLAAPPYEALDNGDRERGIALLRPLADRIVERRGVPGFVAKRLAAV